LAERLAVHGGEPIRRRPWAAWPEWGAPERAALERVLESGSWGGFPSPSDEARGFAERFADYVGAAHAVCCANGTAAITLALQAARVKPGAEVIVPAYTFVGTASSALAAGALPVLVDVLPDTYCIDPDRVEAAITPRTEAIVPVHLGCSMADLDRLEAIAARHGLLLVEDCAHAHGARWRERGAGSVGGLGTFSMQSTKLLTAGEGGAVTTGDGLFAQRLRSLVDCGRKGPGCDGYPEQLLGHNLRMTDWQAALLGAQLERLPEQHARRARNVEAFEGAIAEMDGLRPMQRDPRVTRRAVYQLILRLDRDAFAGASRDSLVAALRAEGIPCSGRFYLPLNEDPLFAMDPLTNGAVRAGIDYASQAFPVARRAAYEEAIWLPHELFLGSGEDVSDLLKAFAKVRAGARELVAEPPAAPAGR
jgi:dTDP-4-amino-4,6-dideoxygalactose transaminase